MHTYIHTYIHHTHIHTHTHSQAHTHRQTDRHTCIHGAAADPSCPPRAPPAAAPALIPRPTYTVFLLVLLLPTTAVPSPSRSFLPLFVIVPLLQVAPGQAGGGNFNFEMPIAYRTEQRPKAVPIGDREASCASQQEFLESDAVFLEC